MSLGIPSQLEMGLYGVQLGFLNSSILIFFIRKTAEKMSKTLMQNVLITDSPGYWGVQEENHKNVNFSLQVDISKQCFTVYNIVYITLYFSVRN